MGSLPANKDLHGLVLRLIREVKGRAYFWLPMNAETDNYWLRDMLTSKIPIDLSTFLLIVFFKFQIWNEASDLFLQNLVEYLD